MRGCTRLRRLIAAGALGVHLSACQHYVPVQGVSPQEYLAARQPREARVRLGDGATVRLLRPSATADSLHGHLPAPDQGRFVPGGQPERLGPVWSEALTKVERIETLEPDGVATAVAVLVSVAGVVGVGAIVITSNLKG